MLYVMLQTLILWLALLLYASMHEELWCYSVIPQVVSQSQLENCTEVTELLEV